MSTSRASATLVGVATAVVLVGVAIAVLLSPPYIHAALDSAGSAAILGVTEAQAEALSDQTVGELVLGPGTFAFPIEPDGPRFYDEAEASHLRDARIVLYWFVALIAVAVGVLVVGARRMPGAAFRRAVSWGGATIAALFAAVGALLVVAFPLAFELFHRLFFPGGNWQFDVETERMVQLYPTPFWELTATVLAILVIGLGAVTWYVARGSRVSGTVESPSRGGLLPEDRRDGL